MPDGAAYLFLAFFLLCAAAGIMEGISIWINRRKALRGVAWYLRLREHESGAMRRREGKP